MKFNELALFPGQGQNYPKVTVLPRTKEIFSDIFDVMHTIGRMPEPGEILVLRGKVRCSELHEHDCVIAMGNYQAVLLLKDYEDDIWGAVEGPKDRTDPLWAAAQSETDGQELYWREDLEGN